MASIQMEQHCYPGLEDNCWCGMPRVLIHWHHLTVARLQVQLVKLLLLLRRKRLAKYAVLGQAYCFMPVAIETLGAFGPKTLSFMKELGRRIMVETGDKRACRHLLQCLSVAVQRVNAAATLRTYLDTRSTALTFSPFFFNHLFTLFL